MKLKYILFSLVYLTATLSSNILFSEEYILEISPNSKLNSVQSDSKLIPIIPRTTSKNSQIQSQNELESLYNFYKADLSSEEIEKYKNNPSVLSIVPNYKFKIEQPTDEDYSDEQWSLDFLNMNEIWPVATGDGILVGVVDTGIDFDHDDFENQLWINSEEDINNNGKFDPWLSTEERDGVTGDLDLIDNDGNGYADDVIGYDFVDVTTRNVGDDQVADPIPVDENRHGTNVSGIIGANSKNNFGVKGIAPGVKLVTLRAFDISGEGESDDIAASIVYAVLNNVKVLNFSFGEKYHSPIIHAAVRFAFANGVTMVSSSGNNNWYEEHYPSDYQEVITVGSLIDDGRKAGSSNYGNRLDIMAPGVQLQTTDFNNSYRSVSGTSIASPHVAAAAAILLEIDNSLTPETIKFRLLSSAREDSEYPGWDPLYGKGILDIQEALNNKTTGAAKLDYPSIKQAIDITEIESIPLVGTIAHPLMSNYQVYIRKGQSPFNEYNFRSKQEFKEWTPVSERMYNQVIDDTLAFIDSELLTDSIYTIRIKLDLINNTTYEERFYFRPYNRSTATRNRYTEKPKPVPFYEGIEAKTMITASTKFDADFYVDLFSEDDEYLNTFSEMIRSELDHSVILEGLKNNNRYKFRAYAVSSEDTLKFTGIFDFKKTNFSTSAFRPKSYRLDGLYFNQELLDSANKVFAATNINGVNFTGASIYKKEGEQFLKTDSLNTPRIIVGYGDSNGDGKQEILTGGNGELILFNQENYKFGEEIFSISNKVVWPTDFVDIDSDGQSEIIAHDDTSYFVLKYDNGSYEEIDRIVMPLNEGRFDNLMSSVFTNVDDDSNMELVFTNSFGRFYIYEYDNGKFTKEFEDLVPISISSQHLAPLDLNQDGIKEILVLNAGYQLPYNFTSGKDLLWTAKIWSYNGEEFESIWQESFSGVKIGPVNNNNNGYKNGVITGNMDGRIGDEIAISVFPDLYVFKYDGSTMQPFWYYGNTLSHDGIVYDFDDNGTNELGINTFFGTQFFEITENEKSINAPSNFRGNPINESTVNLEWDPAPNASEYLVYRLINPNTGQGILYATTDQTKITFDTLENFTWYDFYIVSENDKGVLSNNASELVSCYTHPIIKPLSADINNNIITIQYDGRMPDYGIEPRIFEISNGEVSFTPDAVLSSQSGKVELVIVDSKPDGEYRLTVPAVEDYYRQPTKAEIFDITLESNNNDELYLTSGEVKGKNYRVIFSEDVTESALLIDNYTFGPIGKIKNIEKAESENIVIMELELNSDNSLGNRYTLTANNNVVSADGKQMTSGAGNTLQFTFFEDNLSRVFVYPQPVKLSIDEMMTFANLTATATIYIYNSKGELIKTLIDSDGDGGKPWNMIDDSGNKLNPGVYYYQVEGNSNSVNEESNSNIESELFKFMIIR